MAFYQNCNEGLLKIAFDKRFTIAIYCCIIGNKFKGRFKRCCSGRLPAPYTPICSGNNLFILDWCNYCPRQIGNC